MGVTMGCFVRRSGNPDHYAALTIDRQFIVTSGSKLLFGFSRLGLLCMSHVFFLFLFLGLKASGHHELFF